jgi:hypothetical protein
MSPEPPPRCTAEEIAVVLREVAQPGSRVVVNKRVQDWGETSVWLTTGRLWSVTLWRTEDGLAITEQATSPDGRRWRHGCQRRWLEDGGVIEPLELIGEELRKQLDARLLKAMALPPGPMCPLWIPNTQVADKKPQKRKGRSKRKPKAAGSCKSS